MSFNVLIVENQPLLALNLQDAVEELGHHTIGIASNMYQALFLSEGADVALVEVNLEDGPRGPIVGRSLAEADVTVLFMTSDPGAIRAGCPAPSALSRNLFLIWSLSRPSNTWRIEARAGTTCHRQDVCHFSNDTAYLAMKRRLAAGQPCSISLRQQRSGEVGACLDGWPTISSTCIFSHTSSLFYFLTCSRYQ